MIDVMALAREAGGQTDWDKASRCDPELVDDDVVFERCYLERFAVLVQRATAAECAAMGDAIAGEHEQDALQEKDERFAVYAKHERRYAKAIRARFGVESAC